MERRLVWLCLLSAAMSGACAPETAETEDDLDATATLPRSRGMPIRPAGEHYVAHAGGAAATSNGITYHGGPLMLGTVNLYYIFYGTWSDPAKTILTDFAKGLGGSPYYNINTTYTDGSGAHVSSSVAFKGSITDSSYSKGTSLSDSGVAGIVSSAIKSGKLPKDNNGVYFVLTSADVDETSGFCTQYCGWHSATMVNLSWMKYAWVGNSDRCPGACRSSGAGANGDPGADGMVSVIAHETEEAATDPLVWGWYDANGEENADKCAWNFGATYDANGAKANMKLGTRDFLIQQNWVNMSGGYCAQHYP